jgi:hypothetical protein
VSLNHSLNHATKKKSSKKIEALKNEFGLLETYPLKVAFYDRHFGIIPFEFPSFDPLLPWYQSESAFLRLGTIVNQEQKRSAELYEKHFYSGDQVIVFSIKPYSEPQRWYLNQYIFRKFITEQIDLQQEIKRLQATDEDIMMYLQNRLEKLEDTLTKIRHVLQYQSNESMLRIRFLSIFYKGFTEYNSGSDKMFKVKRKFIELFLYTQGYLVADYMHQLQEHLALFINEQEHTVQKELRKKIYLLQELGIIHFLERKLKREKIVNNKEKLAEWICLITSVDKKNLSSVMRELRNKE